MKRFLFAISALIFSINSYAQFNANEYVDDKTVSTGDLMPMHICPVGFMSGFHEHKNDLLCLHNNGNLDRAGALNDHITNRSGMHACPLGSAMVGIHVKNNVLKCGIPGIPGTDGWPYPKKIDTNSEYISYGGAGSLRYGMHACPEGWVMTGIHVVGNRFLCSLVVNK